MIPPQVITLYGGHTVDHRAVAARGTVLLGRALDFSWLDLPVSDAQGNPRHRMGLTGLPGLYFLGLASQTRRNSAFFNGVGADAAHLAKDILIRTHTPPR